MSPFAAITTIALSLEDSNFDRVSQQGGTIESRATDSMGFEEGNLIRNQLFPEF